MGGRYARQQEWEWEEREQKERERISNSPFHWDGDVTKLLAFGVDLASYRDDVGVFLQNNSSNRPHVVRCTKSGQVISVVLFWPEETGYVSDAKGFDGKRYVVNSWRPSAPLVVSKDERDRWKLSCPEDHITAPHTRANRLAGQKLACPACPERHQVPRNFMPVKDGITRL